MEINKLIIKFIQTCRGPRIIKVILKKHKTGKLRPSAIKAYFKTNNWGFPGGAVVKNLPANAGDTGSSPGLGRSHMLRSN